MENSELLTILEQLERDKGIDKKILIEAVESAVASAARKLWTVDKNEEIEVVLDPKNGKLKAFANGQEIRSDEFGRIAAQTAKQVVIQKIREAEKDVIFNEYDARVGQIISGSIYRFEKGNIIIDLGKAEGQIPRKEQSPKEEFKQGDRVRTYLLGVEKENRGPQIILSRAHPNFVKRLFELEVPEIYEGIVEIKSISRDVGERTKIAVYSKDEKVDCVGACVGMRGSRVKNIVSEIQGEKIDIVRYADDIKEYIQAALAPAEISQIQLNYEDKKANIIVANDQLSLAIGKHGQNVRLASELVGWELDLFSFDQWNKLNDEMKEQAAEEAAEATSEQTAAAEELAAKAFLEEDSDDNNEEGIEAESSEDLDTALPEEEAENIEEAEAEDAMEPEEDEAKGEEEPGEEGEAEEENDGEQEDGSDKENDAEEQKPQGDTAEGESVDEEALSVESVDKDEDAADSEDLEKGSPSDQDLDDVSSDDNERDVDPTTDDGDAEQDDSKKNEPLEGEDRENSSDDGDDNKTVA